MSANSETWQVMTGGELFESDLESLKQWVADGGVQPTDKVRKGNLRWIEAIRVPALRPIFYGEDLAPQEMPPAPVALSAQSQTEINAQAHAGFAGQTSTSFSSQSETAFINPASDQTHTPQFDHAQGSQATTPAASNYLPPTDAACCYNHPDLSPDYVCRVCNALFCAQCPKYMGGSKVPLCTLCGDLCKPFADLINQSVRQEFQLSGFGLSDFRQAVAYPLHNKIALFSGALLYGFLLLAGWKGQMLAYAVLFASISLVVKQTAWGRFNNSFLPDFGSFSMLDDFLVPLGLGVGILIVTLGPILLLLLTLWFGWINNPAAAKMQFEQLQKEQEQNKFTPQDMQDIIKGSDPEKAAAAAKKLEAMNPGAQLAEEMKKAEEAHAKSDADNALAMFRRLTGIPIVMYLLLFLSLLWAFFYYPMALTVAGFTEQFSAVVNPLIGLDTMRRMGFVYVKAFGMYVVIGACELIVGMILSKALSAFDVPLIGNLPVRFLGGMTSFYFSLTLACVLGLALYKCADKLDIQTD
jgi:uncharacterized membrane protein